MTVPEVCLLTVTMAILLHSNCGKDALKSSKESDSAAEIYAVSVGFWVTYLLESPDGRSWVCLHFFFICIPFADINFATEKRLLRKAHLTKTSHKSSLTIIHRFYVWRPMNVPLWAPVRALTEKSWPREKYVLREIFL